jgi:mannose-6-phosphate isomerase
MTVEHAHARALPKPWGVVDPRPWSNAGDGVTTIGEIWYERADAEAVPPSLLLKLLFTNQPLSIQVHPDDAYAQSTGRPTGKTEAWHILSAAPDAALAMGLKRRVSSQQLRHAIDDGSISELVAWHQAHSGDTILVPAGTIHAIGAGMVIAEIQQRSDITFRLFDYGRGRDLHIEGALAVANAGPADFLVDPTRLSDARTLLVSNAYFTFERIDLMPDSTSSLEAEHETWMLVISGGASAASNAITIGDALFAQSDHVNIRAGRNGLVALVAYAGGLVPQLLKCVDMETIQ